MNRFRRIVCGMMMVSFMLALSACPRGFRGDNRDDRYDRDGTRDQNQDWDRNRDRDDNRDRGDPRRDR